MDVPPPPPHVRNLAAATAVLAGLVVLVCASAVAVPGIWAVVLTVVAVLLAVVGGGLLAGAFAARRRYVEALLRWAAADPSGAPVADLLVALTATGAHREAQLLLQFPGFAGRPRPPVPGTRRYSGHPKRPAGARPMRARDLR